MLNLSHLGHVRGGKNLYVFIFYFLVLENISTYVEQVNGSQVLVMLIRIHVKRLEFFQINLFFYNLPIKW